MQNVCSQHFEITGVFFYRPPKKLRESNVFTGFCQFTGKEREVRIILECILVFRNVLSKIENDETKRFSV